MKIIQISTFFYPEIGGVEKQCSEITSNLLSRNIDALVYTTDASHSSKRMARQDISKRDNYIVTFRYLIALQKYFRFAPSLVLKLLFSKFDIVHIHNIHDAHILFVIIIKLIRRKKIVVTGHNPFVNKKVSFSYRIFHAFLRILSPYIDTYIALTKVEHDSAKKILKLKDSQIKIIPNGINESFFDTKEGLETKTLKKLNKKEYNYTLGWYGRFDPVKGLINLRKAISTFQDILFVFRGPDNNYIEELRNQFSKFKNVVLEETHLDTNEVINFLNSIDFLVVPSLYESFGLTVVEAMASKTPVLFSDGVGIASLVQNRNGGIVVKNKEDEWVNNIQKATSRKDLDLIISNNFDFAQNYKWSKIMGEIISIYTKLNASKKL